MARTYFGDEEPLDFHGGGIDLKFPHHENEIAQSEGATPGTTFCNCWFHNGFVNMGDEKMSKSLGNFITLLDACPTGLDVRAYRYLIVSSHYRNPLRFTETVMAAYVKAIKRLDKVKSALEMALQDYSGSDDVVTNNSSDLVTKTVPDAMTSFEIAIADDLSMPRAAAALFSLVKAAEQELKRVANVDDDPPHRLDLAGLKAIRDAMERMDQVFGIFYQTRDEITHNEQVASPIPDGVRVLVDQRTAAKNAKDWELADSLRNRIAELEFAVKDVKGGDPIAIRQ
jgi:cysteinyl-tRNA synthetase